MSFQNCILKARSSYDRLVHWQNAAGGLFVLLLRLNWGWLFFQAGKGKLQNTESVIGFFQQLGIPWPAFNAHLVGTVECFGGLCLLLGFASRLVTIPLAAVMFVAYLTAHREGFFAFFSDAGAFAKEAPFPFLMTILIVMFFGAGPYSLDRLLKKFKK